MSTTHRVQTFSGVVVDDLGFHPSRDAALEALEAWRLEAVAIGRPLVAIARIENAVEAIAIAVRGYDRPPVVQTNAPDREAWQCVEVWNDRSRAHKWTDGRPWLHRYTEPDPVLIERLQRRISTHGFQRVRWAICFVWSSSSNHLAATQGLPLFHVMEARTLRGILARMDTAVELDREYRLKAWRTDPVDLPGGLGPVIGTVSAGVVELSPEFRAKVLEPALRGAAVHHMSSHGLACGEPLELEQMVNATTTTRPEAQRRYVTCEACRRALGLAPDPSGRWSGVAPDDSVDALAYALSGASKASQELTAATGELLENHGELLARMAGEPKDGGK